MKIQPVFICDCGQPIFGIIWHREISQIFTVAVAVPPGAYDKFMRGGFAVICSYIADGFECINGSLDKDIVPAAQVKLYSIYLSCCVKYIELVPEGVVVFLFMEEQRN